MHSYPIQVDQNFYSKTKLLENVQLSKYNNPSEQISLLWKTLADLDHVCSLHRLRHSLAMQENFNFKIIMASASGEDVYKLPVASSSETDVTHFERGMRIATP